LTNTEQQCIIQGKGDDRVAFGDKLKKLRTDRSWSQAEAGKAIGVSERVYGYYETNERTPAKPEVIQSIMDTFGVSFEYLFSPEEAFQIEASQKYGSIGNKQAQTILKGADTLFAGGEIDEDAKDEMFEILSKLYFEAKKINKEKYGRK